MNNDQDFPAKPKDLDTINKNKILISQIQFQSKQSECVKCIFIPAFASFFGSIFILPYALKVVPYLRSSFELRFITGALGALPLSYLVIKRSKERCEKRVDDTYYYGIVNN